ncbi:MAG: VOC family protein [Planctomycetota bacterium]
MRPFHLAVPVDDLAAARGFYGALLGCPEGRSDTDWIDFDLYGHQLVVHRTEDARPDDAHNPVDGHAVPIPHFGVVLSLEEWHALVERLGDRVSFVIEPTIRFEGQPGEQATMFFRDPSGNALEFKAFADPEQLFAR